MKVYVVQGEHDYVPGRPMYICATQEAADKKAAELVSLLCGGYDIPKPEQPSHWLEALRDVQDRIVKDNGIELDDPDDPEELGNATGMDVWINEHDVIE